MASLTVLSLKVGRLTFTLKPLPIHPDWLLSLETLIWFECPELCSLCLNYFLSKRVSLLRVPQEAEGLSAAYASFDLSSSSASGHSVSPVHGSHHHFILSPHQSLLPILSSMLSQLGSPWPSGLCPLLHHSFEDGTLTLHSFPQSFYLHCSPSPVEQASQAKLSVPCAAKGKSLIFGMHTKEQDGLLWGQDHSFSYPVFQTGFLQYVSDQTSSPCMGWRGLITTPISQHYSHLYTIMSSIFGGRQAVSSMPRGY